MATKKLTAVDVRNTEPDFDWLVNFIIKDNIIRDKSDGLPYHILSHRYDRDEIIEELKRRGFKVKENPEGRKCVIW